MAQEEINENTKLQVLAPTSEPLLLNPFTIIRIGNDRIENVKHIHSTVAKLCDTMTPFQIHLYVCWGLSLDTERNA